MMKKITVLSFLFLFSFSTIFASSTSAASVFTDVPETDPNYKDLKLIYDKDLLPEIKFTDGHPLYPNSKATRLMVLNMFGDIIGLQKYDLTSKFSDLSNFGEIRGLVHEETHIYNIMKGYPDGTFRPYGNVTRGELAISIKKAFSRYLPYSTETKFKDIPKSHEGHNSISMVAEAGILSGYPDKTFKPNETLTKKQLLVIMARVVRYLESKNVQVPIYDRTKPVDDKKIILGMERDQVSKIMNHRALHGHATTTSSMTNIARNGLAGETYYDFTEMDDNFSVKLKKITHYFDWSTLKPQPKTLKELHEFYRNEFIKEFGEGYETIVIDGENILTRWETPSTSIWLTSFATSDNEAFVYLNLTDNKLKDK